VSDSRFIKYDRRKFPKEKKTIPFWGAASPGAGYGAGSDRSGVLFKCWNCGFLCNTNRDELGDGVGYVVTDEARIKIPRLGSGDIRDVSLSIGIFQSGARLMQLDAVGDPVTVVHNMTQRVYAGCPHCGSKNWK
jgi:predicted RNA-binding Zn-ribbon protein involved in translation (DUF1610 family)